jgi:hypothetical protein
MLVSPGGLHLPKRGLTLLLDGVSEELKNVEKPWPRDENSPIHTINYCYLVKWMRQSVSEYVEPAVKMWMGKLGEPGPDNEHPITFKEARDSDENPRYCLEGKLWNPEVTNDALVVTVAVGPPVEATVGHQPPALGYSANRLALNTAKFEQSRGAVVAAHELGKLG